MLAPWPLRILHDPSSSLSAPADVGSRGGEGRPWRYSRARFVAAAAEPDHALAQATRFGRHSKCKFGTFSRGLARSGLKVPPAERRVEAGLVSDSRIRAGAGGSSVENKQDTLSGGIQDVMSGGPSCGELQSVTVTAARYELPPDSLDSPDTATLVSADCTGQLFARERDFARLAVCGWFTGCSESRTALDRACTCYR
jgi:hypothetical protein